jgi:hypothetical protein
MATENPELQSIRERLEKLERQNRWLKRTGLAVLLLTAAVLLMGQARPSHTVTATKFVLLDSQGRTRAILQTDSTGATLTFLDSMGRKRMVLAGGTGPVGNTYAYLELGEDAATEQGVLTTAGGHGGVTLSDGGLVMGVFPPSEKAGSVMLSGPGGVEGPDLEITDSQGYQANMGVTDLITPSTGETHRTSAASVVLFGKGGKVLWSAPPQ